MVYCFIYDKPTARKCKKIILQYKILIKSKSKLYFCCRNHKDISQRIGGIKELHPAHYGNGSYKAYRRVAFSEKEKFCERCKFNDERAIIVHHRDRNRKNCSPENLEVLCCNCHAIEHNMDTKKYKNYQRDA